ncbi:hypothetical protein [Paenibacillus tundrae]|uniref:hypothetical protein n=1 Tax=Paenibacillus tundrae TaxID=528187 RepID=UPI0030D30491
MLKQHVQASVPLGVSGTSTRLLEDYKLEEMLRSPHRFIRPEPEITQASQLLWRHRVQYAVSHAVNAFYSMDPEVRKEVPVQYMLEKWWPKKTTGFESVLHYWEVKNKIIDELSRIIRTNEDLQHPSILFEQWKTEIPSLSMELSMIFHAAWQPEGWDSLLIQKYMVVYDPNVVEAFQHMASVFCYEAFGTLPGMIEVYCLLEGRKVRFMPGRQSLARSMDYIHLIRDSVPQAEDVESDQFSARDKARIHEEADRRRSELETKKTWLM